jgi:hypothetical protein
MPEDSTVRVVGKSTDGQTASVTVQVPIEQLGEYSRTKELATGSWSDSGLGERYGLRPDTQAMRLPTQRLAQIKLARDLYESEPIVATVIDLMIDFSITGMENRCEDQKAKEYFDGICKYGDFDGLHRQMLKEYWISSDIFIMRGRKHTLTTDPDRGTVYFDFAVLNPLFVEVDGPLIFDSTRIGVRPSAEIIKMVKDKKTEQLALRKIPLGLRKAVESGSLYFPDDILMSRISRKRSSYERYATPYLTRVFEPVLLKRRMREADLALNETVRNVLVTFTIGDADFPATKAQLEELAMVASTPSKSMDLFWNHTLKVEYHYPAGDLFAPTKYDQVNKDIMQGLGIPPVLIDGGGGTFATAWTSLLSVMEKLESVRMEIARWQEAEYRRISEAEKLKFKVLPSVSFKPLNLRDDKVFISLLLEMYDRGLISIETVMSLSPVDLDMKVEARNRIAEKQAKMDTVFKPRAKAPSTTPGRKSTNINQDNYAPRDKIPDVPAPPTEKPTPKKKK